MHLSRFAPSRFALPLLAAALVLTGPIGARSQAAPAAAAPAGAPTGATGLCNDGSYWTGTTRSFSCRGHKGLKTWFGTGANAPANSVTAKPQPTVPVAKPALPSPNVQPAGTAKPAPQPNVTPASAKKATQQQAPGGGNGQVWVNLPTKVYHCPGDRYYGKTKDGKYMSEADAKAMGAHGERGGSCSK